MGRGEGDSLREGPTGPSQNVGSNPELPEGNDHGTILRCVLGKGVSGPWSHPLIWVNPSEVSTLTLKCPGTRLTQHREDSATKASLFLPPSCGMPAQRTDAGTSPTRARLGEREKRPPGWEEVPPPTPCTPSLSHRSHGFFPGLRPLPQHLGSLDSQRLTQCVLRTHEWKDGCPRLVTGPL